MQRWLKDREQIRLVDPPTLERAFWYDVERRVSKDATISVEQRLFEVPQTFIGARVRVHYHPDDLSHVYLQAQPDGPLVPVTPLCKVDNAFIPRRQNERPPIAFRELFAPREER